MARNRNNKGNRQSNSGNGGTVGQSDSTGSAEGIAPEGGSGDAPTEPTAEAAPVDPFADVPVTRIGEGDDAVEFANFADTPTALARKYEAVNKAAVADRMPTAKGWKHEEHMLIPGSLKAEKKAGSVYGDIQQIVNAAGRAGIPAYVVATMLRKKQVGNKRSHYCDGLPPVGWAEGWINTAITKNIAGVHPTKQAPALRTVVTEGEAEAKKQIAANG